MQTGSHKRGEEEVDMKTIIKVVNANELALTTTGLTLLNDNAVPLMISPARHLQRLRG